VITNYSLEIKPLTEHDDAPEFSDDFSGTDEHQKDDSQMFNDDDISVTDEQQVWPQPETTSQDFSENEVYEEEYCCIKNRYFLETLEPKKDVLAQYLQTDEFHKTIRALKTPPPLVKNLKFSSALPDLNSKDLEFVISNFNRSWSTETTDNNTYTKEPRRKKPRGRYFKRTNL